MRPGVLSATIMLSALGIAHTAAAETPFEQQVLAALNGVRTDPASFARDLQQYRTYFRGTLLHYPGQTSDLETEEGVAAVDETVEFLAKQTPLAPVANAPLLAASASDLAADQARGGTGHESSDGASPSDRARRHGGGAYIAEVIAYGPMDAADVVRQLVIDDGVPDRGHRLIIYAPELRFAGVACGPHPQYDTVCVIDLSATQDGRPSRGQRRTTR